MQTGLNLTHNHLAVLSWNFKKNFLYKFLFYWLDFFFNFILPLVFLTHGFNTNTCLHNCFAADLNQTLTFQMLLRNAPTSCLVSDCLIQPPYCGRCTTNKQIPSSAVFRRHKSAHGFWIVLVSVGVTLHPVRSWFMSSLSFLALQNKSSLNTLSIQLMDWKHAQQKLTSVLPSICTMHTCFKVLTSIPQILANRKNKVIQVHTTLTLL